MKIAVVSTYFQPFDGGVERNCLFLAKELAKKHEVHIFTSDRKNGIILHKKEDSIYDIKVHRLKTIFRYRYYFCLNKGLISELLNGNFDIVHFHSLGFLQHDAAILLLKLLRKNAKLVSSPHGPALATSNSLARYFFRGVLKLENLINAFYDAVIAQTPLQISWLESMGISRNKITTILPGIPKKYIDVPYTKPKVAKNNFVISYVGRIQPYKGLEQIISVLPELLKYKKNLLFVLIGQDAGAKQNLLQLAHKLNVKNNVLFLDYLSEEDKLAWLTASEIFVFPSEWEAFGIAMLEAMAKGNAIISTKTEGGKFLIKEGNNGFLFDYGSLKQLEHKLIELIENNKLRKNMQVTNAKMARNFIWEKQADNLEKLYQELVSKK